MPRQLIMPPKPPRPRTVRQGRLLALLALTAGGCAVHGKKAFQTLQSRVHRRTSLAVSWQRHGRPSRALRRRISALLQKPLSARTAQQIALLNNPSLQATIARVGIAQAAFVQAGLLANPVVFASERFPDRPPSGVDAEESVAADFLSLLSLPLRKAVAKRQLAATQLQVASAVLRVARDTQVAYYRMAAQAQLLGRLRLMLKIDRLSLRLVGRQYKAGTISNLAYASQQATVSQAMVDVANARLEAAEDRQRLNEMMGLWGAQTAWKLPAKLSPLPRLRLKTGALEAYAVRHSFALAAQRQNILALRTALGAAKAYRYLGVLAVGVDTEKGPDGQNVTGPTLEATIPVFDQDQARIARVRYALRQARQEQRRVAIHVRTRVRRDEDRLAAAQAEAHFIHHVLLPERVGVMNLSQQMYNGMLLGVYDLLLARQKEVAAERTYDQAWRDYFIARADLQRDLGGEFPRGAFRPAAPLKAVPELLPRHGGGKPFYRTSMHRKKKAMRMNHMK